MSRDQWDWEKQVNGTYTRSSRGYDATITIESNGKATLAIVGVGAPANVTYDTRRQAMAAFQSFLRDKPVE